MNRYQAHRIEPEPPLDWTYLAKCLLTLGLIAVALWCAMALGWATVGPQ